MTKLRKLLQKKKSRVVIGIFFTHESILVVRNEFDVQEWEDIPYEQKCN